YSGMREVFVTVIFGTGAFLIGYKIAEVNLDNTASILAGAGALCLVWFPTKPGGNKIPAPRLTPLQEHWTPSSVVVPPRGHSCVRERTGGGRVPVRGSRRKVVRRR